MLERWATLAIFGGIVGGAVFACGTTIPTEAMNPPSSDGGGTVSAPVDGATETVSDGSALVDVFDAGKPAEHGGNGNEGPCSSSDRPGSGDVFVTETAKDEKPCGTVDQPCTLDNAIASKPSVINIANGTYVGNFAISSLNGLRVLGGWDVSGTTWTRSCKEHAVTIRTDASSQGMLVDGSAVTLAYVDLASRPTATEPGKGLYGLVVVNGSRVTLDHVHVTAAAGLDGALGASGAVSSPPPCTPSGDGSNGAAGTPGAAGKISFEALGVVGSAATAGGSGQPGGNGTLAELPPLVTTGYRCQKSGQDCVQGICNGVRDETGRGTNGCGGAQGTGGGAGGNGGTSIALYVTGASSVNVVAGSMTSGRGGNGGSGGNGGGGQSGTAGTAGAARPVSNCFVQPPTNEVCGDTNVVLPQPVCTPDNPIALGLDPLYVAGGPAGGTGGTGGSGGAGGGGAGGYSYSVWSDAPSVLDFDKTAFAHATAGAAGPPNGPAGVAADSNK